MIWPPEKATAVTVYGFAGWTALPDGGLVGVDGSMLHPPLTDALQQAGHVVMQDPPPLARGELVTSDRWPQPAGTELMLSLAVRVTDDGSLETTGTAVPLRPFGASTGRAFLRLLDSGGVEVRAA